MTDVAELFTAVQRAHQRALSLRPADAHALAAAVQAWSKRLHEEYGQGLSEAQWAVVFDEALDAREDDYADVAERAFDLAHFARRLVATH